MSYSGSVKALVGTGGQDSFHGSLRNTSRAMRMPSASSSARNSATPETVACISAPPRSSSNAISPVAAFNSGGPARNTFDFLRTMMTYRKARR